jgi:peroxiredoxin
MKHFFLLLLLATFWAPASYAQTGVEALQRYRARIRTLRSVGYSVQRIDTFANGAILNNRGRGVVAASSTSALFGGHFQAERFGMGGPYFYNGQKGYLLDDKAKTYLIQDAPYPPTVQGSPAGQMLVEELLAIDTTYQSVHYDRTPQGGLLTLRYPDQPNIDVSNHYTYLLLDPATSLPYQVRTVMQRGGGKWVTRKLLSDVRLNDTADIKALQDPSFLITHTRMLPAAQPVLASQTGQRAPNFQLLNFLKEPVKLSSYTGKVVLLDFWETACSPCIASMPKVQHWQDAYGKQGLVVLGVLVEPGSTVRAQGILQRQHATYTNLVADKAVETAYKVSSFPRYVLVDKAGTIVFDESGASPQLELAIRKALGLAQQD